MKKIQLTIEGYKCFEKKNEVWLNKMTLLTGANSAGKSSIIQSIILGKIVSETSCEDYKKCPVPLKNDKYAMDLGGYLDIINRDTKTGDISFSLDGIKYDVKGKFNEDEKIKNVLFSIDANEREQLKAFYQKGFAYLCADRKAPSYEYSTSNSLNFCDCHGANVGDVFSAHQGDEVFSSRSLNFRKDIKVLIQLDEWCDYIFPGIAVRVEKTGTEMYKLKVRDDVAPNVGFGITYALPVLVSGLIIPEGGTLIVENPEAHLHAKAQSNMGYFLARMAASGLRVIIETHSEHIVNGIRRMAIEESSNLAPDDVSIYFFQNKNGEKTIKEITIDNKGNLSEFPEDFFDQVRQDMLTILQVGRAKKY